MKVSLFSLCVFLTALKDSSKKSINSDWKIELPGEFELAGTTVRYVRRGLWEKMSAKGPTKTPLHLMVNTSVYPLYVIIINTLNTIVGLKQPGGGSLWLDEPTACMIGTFYSQLVKFAV